MAGTRRRRLRTLGATLLALLGGLALLVGFLPQLLQSRIERAAGEALQTPVAIGWVSIAGALGGVVGVEQVAVGDDGALTIARVAVRVDRRALLDRRIVLEQLEVDGLRATLEQDAQGRPALRGLPFPSPSDEPADGAPSVTVQQVLVRDAAIEAIPPAGLRRHPVAVRLDELVLRQVPTADAGPAWEGELRGALDGVPLIASARSDQTAAGPRIEAQADLTGAPVSSEQMILPPGLESLTATADGKIAYQLDPALKRDRLTVDLALSDVKLAGAEKTSLTAKRFAVAGATLDLTAGKADLGKVSITAPRIEAALTDDGLAYPGLVPALVDSGVEPPEAELAAKAKTPTAWRVVGGEITARDAAFAVQRGDQRAQLDVPSFAWRGIASGKPGELRIDARASTGGTIDVRGELGIDPARFDVTADVSGLALPELTALLDLRMQLARGSANGSVQLTGDPAAPHVTATLDVSQLHTRPPEGEDAERILAVDRLETRFTVEPGPGGAIDVSALTLSYPYAMVQREASGIFPVDVLAGEASTGATEETAAEAGAHPTRPVRIGTVTVSNGRLDFVDQTTQPPFWMGVASAEAMVRDVWLTPLTAGQLDFSARQDELHPVRAAVRRTGDASWQGTATLDAISLATLNPYLSPVLGYEAQTGTLTLDLDATLEQQQLVATGAVSLDGVGLKQTGLDVIQRQTGVPLSVAVSLLKDVGGEIELSIPLTIDTTTGKYELGDFVTQAIGRAVMGALSSPLRWLGMLFGSDGPPQALAIDPIPFQPGSATLDDAGATRVTQVARILASHAELDVILKAQIAAQDTSAAGTASLEDLARRRVDAVRSAFASTRGGAPILASRLIVAPWTPPADGKLDAAPAVYVEVQSR